MAAGKAIISPELGELLAARTELVLDPAGPAALARADVFLASSHRALSAADLEYGTRLAVVTQVGTAVHVDVPAATRLGIPVLHNRGENADSVAEHTIALLLAVAKNIPFVATRRFAAACTGRSRRRTWSIMNCAARRWAS